MDIIKFDLSKEICAEIVHLHQFAPGSDLYRAIIDIISKSSENRALIKTYEVWATTEAVEDRLQLSQGASLKDIERFVIKTLRSRYTDERKVPDEDGIYFPTGSEIDIIKGNPRTFPFKLPEKQKQNLVKTTVMLPSETMNWLRDYGHDKKIGIGEAIRRVVSDFRQGTISKIDSSDSTTESNAGVPLTK